MLANVRFGALGASEEHFVGALRGLLGRSHHLLPSPIHFLNSSPSRSVPSPPHSGHPCTEVPVSPHTWNPGALRGARCHDRLHAFGKRPEEVVLGATWGRFGAIRALLGMLKALRGVKTQDVVIAGAPIIFQPYSSAATTRGSRRLSCFPPRAHSQLLWHQRPPSIPQHLSPWGFYIRQRQRTASHPPLLNLPSRFLPEQMSQT